MPHLPDLGCAAGCSVLPHELDQLAGELRRASAGSDAEYAAVLERVGGVCVRAGHCPPHQ
jgi:hypothetical protein